MDWEDVKRGIFAGESGGDYNALYGYSNRPGGQFSGTKVTDMTLDEALNFSNPSGAYGQAVKSQIGTCSHSDGRISSCWNNFA